MRSSTLKIVVDPINLGWQLRSRHSPNVTVMVLGWTMPQPSVDAGVPTSIINLISKALCDVGQVSFLDPDSSIKLSPSSLDRLKGKPPFAITTTSDANIASRLFDIAAFPWEQQSQIVILHSADSTPAFDYTKLFELWSEPSPDLKMLADALQATGYLFPGVDGDFAEVVMLETNLRDHFKTVLVEECRQADILFQEVSSEAFRNINWTENS